MSVKELIITAIITVAALFCATTAAHANPLQPSSTLTDTPWD
ncbi:hypothetical protein [Streptosporangium sp. NPDC000396]